MEEGLSLILSSYEGKREEIIPILQHVQEKYGYLSEASMLEIARFVGVPESRVYAIATFYSQFRFAPIGRNHITVCRGTACHVRGAPRLMETIESQLGIKDGETTEDKEFSLETVACIGACGLSPCIVINKEVKANMTPNRVKEFLKQGEDKKA